MGEAFNHARNAAPSSSGNGPAWLAMNHSAACWAIAVRISSSLGVMASFPLRHSASAVSQSLGQIFLYHVGRYSKPVGDLLVGEPVAILQDERGTPPVRQLLEHGAQALDPLTALELAVQRGQFSEPLLDAGLFELLLLYLALLPERVLLDEVAGYCVQVELRVADRLGVAHPQHPCIDLLGEVGSVGLGLDPTIEVRLQGTPVLCKQLLHEPARWAGHCVLALSP